MVETKKLHIYIYIHTYIYIEREREREGEREREIRIKQKMHRTTNNKKVRRKKDSSLCLRCTYREKIYFKKKGTKSKRETLTPIAHPFYLLKCDFVKHISSNNLIHKPYKNTTKI